MPSSTRYGLDIGSMNFRISKGGSGIILNDKTMIAVRKKELLSAGNDAYEMFERTPRDIRITWPVENGVIKDIRLLGMTTEALLKKSGLSAGIIRNKSFYIAAPSDANEVEKRAYFNIISNTAFTTHNIHIIQKPLAAAIGEDMPIRNNAWGMLVDMGAGATEVSIMTGGGVVVSRLLREGGNTINASIQNLILRNRNLLIGYKSAEYLKLELGSAVPTGSRTVKVYGRDRSSGFPASADIPEKLVFAAMKPYLVHVVRIIKDILGNIPAEYSEDIEDYGIHFTGGTSMMPNLEKLMKSILSTRVFFSDRPLESTSRGIAKICENPQEYKSLIFSMRDEIFEQ
ncbi:MAG: rod shape-determining protein [Lachnospiraceae bacterium]|nr:rod shape-determining protein [Lachnospiraceae bacterium]